MTDSAPAQPAENVGLGTALALVSIPIGMLIFGLAGAVGYFLFIVPIVIPAIAHWLYGRGAGAPLTRRGWVPFIAVSVVAVFLGVLTGLLVSAFTATGSNLARFLPVVGTTLRYQITEQGLWVLLAIAIGVAGIVGVIRGPRPPRGSAPQVADGSPISTDASAAVTGRPESPAQAPGATQPAQTPSPGVILNGKPLDDQQR
jgi:hypothetical protein